MSSLEDLKAKVFQFRKERDWEVLSPKDLAISISLEANEVLEHFQWKDEAEIKEYVVTHKEEIGDELSDVLIYLLFMAKDLDIDLVEAASRKSDKNAQKYPVEKAKGNHTKYTEL